MKKLLNQFVAAVTMIGVFGCSSSTLTRASDPETKIYIDGEYKSKGQYQYSDTKIVGATTNIRLEKDGCEPVSYTMTRNEEFDAGACAGGVFVLVPFLWIMKYKGEHSYEYTCHKKK